MLVWGESINAALAFNVLPNNTLKAMTYSERGGW